MNDTDGMVASLSGESGMSKLVEVLCRQELVTGDVRLARRIAEAGELVAFAKGQVLCTQGDSSSDVFVLLSGDVDVIVNGHQVTVRSGGQTVGELSAIDAVAYRSATVMAAAPVVALRLTDEEFRIAGEGSPQFWCQLAQVVAERLREREKLHVPANARPLMFLGSSVEGLQVAEAIASGLEHDVDARVWTNGGVFGPSATPVDDLVEQLDVADFAVFVFGPDDSIASRGEDGFAPRDNVVFEMGLFLGRLGRDRVFMVKDSEADLKLPSDLTGVSPITYRVREGTAFDDAIASVCRKLKRVVLERGVVLNRVRASVGHS